MLASFRKHQFLFEQLIQRELRQKYQGSVLGLLWYLINPLLLVGCYYVMFGVVLPGGFGHKENYPLFIATSMIVWLLVSASLPAAGDSLLAQAALIRKANFPREMIPTASVIVQVMTFVALLLIVTVLTVAFQGTLGLALLLIPVIVILLVVFVEGLALAISAMHANFRDVLPIIGAIMVPWFFISPIFYEPKDILKGHTFIQGVLEWGNPVAPYCTAMRSVLFYGEVPSAGVMIYITVAAATSIFVGSWIFRKLSRDLAVIL